MFFPVPVPERQQGLLSKRKDINMFVNLLCPINTLGYGVVGFNIFRALHEAGHTVSLFPINNPLRDQDVEGYKEHIDTIKKGLLNAKTYNHEAPSIRIWHQHELDKFVGGATRIGFPIFELDRFTDLERHQLESVDRLFVCSEWARGVIAANGIDTPTDVIPLGFDPEIFYVDQEAKKRRPYYSANTTTFINVGKWEVRKGHNELLEAFNRAFTPEDDVKLIMMNHNPFLGPAGNKKWESKYLSSPMGSKIKIQPRVKTQNEMRELFNQVDFGVFPSHAEGWNLEILELMACGAPCIATNYSGHTEFLNSSNSLLVETNGIESAQDGVWFHGQGNWCSFDVNELVKQMKYAHQIKQDPSPTALSSTCVDAAKNFTWQKTAEKIAKIL